MKEHQWFDLLYRQSKAVKIAAHAVGLDNRAPYRRNGKEFYTPYRNYFGTGEKCDGVDIWLDFEKQGYAERYDGWVFCMTRKGLDWLGGALDITIHDESD